MSLGCCCGLAETERSESDSMVADERWSDYPSDSLLPSFFQHWRLCTALSTFHTFNDQIALSSVKFKFKGMITISKESVENELEDNSIAHQEKGVARC